jgi:hypothetical protein
MDRSVLGYLVEINRNIEGALALMAKLAAYPELNNQDFIIYQSYFREYLADTNLLILDALGSSEQSAMLEANRERVAYERSIRDPDDCYLEVKHREEVLREQGKPSNIGILFGMRKLTREEIMYPSFGDTASDDAEATFGDEDLPQEHEGGSDGNS